MARGMQSTLLVMAGGALGAAARFHAGAVLTATIGSRWPWGTLAVNAAGGLLIGLLAGWATVRGIAEPWRLLLGVGILGGFTTFSAFSLETWQMIERDAWLDAAGYVAASVCISVLLAGVGIALSRMMLA